ncbi:hypothetical protein BCIN_06g04280 [Botrytis cinerea B05.10]|uniref:Zn(2)-C6 fungal-type domain-containing protein n=1 Tax=Botryotinia fuckeliana (strain B05.10) TaxID=332648 RepID=A0A384JKR7_BOTFB|nr:hypothetical protein BCIN_06g04280 [Botrytis cinerea B05.10]ATZ50964.1 hypothetical protein BCIN_06g04280 [Botrytis cinerea B05.10]
MNPSTGLQFAPEHQQHHSEKGCRGKHDPSHNKAEDMSTKPTSLPCRRTFRRPRAGRACGMCHSRRVRCDAGSHGIPCTNCEAFFLDCNIPPRKKNASREGTSAGRRKSANQSILTQT